MAGSRDDRAGLHHAPPALAFERVSFAYDRGAVVRDLSLRVGGGELVGLLGPNGSGKSTVLKLGAGVLRPRSGSVTLGDLPVRAMSRGDIARRLAVVPQELTVQFAYTVRQIVELGRTPHVGIFGVFTSTDTDAVERALAATDVAHLAGRTFNELSGGERQRVLVALALAQETEVVLLDEPTAHLDIRFQVGTLELVRRLNGERGITVLAALHDLNLAARYFPRLVLFDGAVVADGTPAQVLDGALLSRVYGTPVRVGRLPGEQHITVLPATPEPE